ncbi:ATP-binding protein [Nonomuraea sp. NPDC003754]
MIALTALPAFAVHEVPRPGDVDGSGRAGSRQRLAAVSSAFHAGAGPIAMAWIRPRAGGPVDVLVAGRALAGSRHAGTAALRLPTGAGATPLGAEEFEERLAQLPSWCRVTAICDGLLLEDDPPREQSSRPSLEDGLLAVWQEPFAWLLLAEPVTAEELAAMTQQAAEDQRRAQARTSSPRYEMEARRAKTRYTELVRGGTSGMWRVHLLAAGADPAAAAQVAGLVCASADLDGLPYQLVPTGKTGALDPTLADGAPFVGSSRLVATLAVPPAREIPGVRLVDRPSFDVTPEAGTAGLEIGVVLDGNRRPAGPLRLETASLNRHAFVTGATGGGKSRTIRTLLQAATDSGIPWLVVEPAKAEYRTMAERLPGTEVIAIRPGETEVAPACLNPLEPEAGFPLQTHADLVKALFLAAFQSDEPFPQVLAAALTRCYTELGWDLTLGEPLTPGLTPRHPTLADLERAADQVVDEIGYGKEIADNVHGFIRVRVSSLRQGTSGRFLHDGHPLDIGKLLATNVVLEIEDVGDDQSKSFLMGTILLRLVEHLRVHRRGAAGLMHLTVVEEAHRLLRRGTQGPAAHAVEMFASMLAEARAYGEGLIIADQIPSKLVDDVIKNTAVKIVHRLPAADDREAVGATMHLTEEQSGYIVTLPPGQAAVFADGFDYPLLTQMHPGPEERPAAVASDSRRPASGEGERQGLVVAVDTLVSRRSSACGTDCATRACTLREMSRARRPDPSLVLWAELGVLGHLTGWGLPLPEQELRDQLGGMERRSRHCALGQAVDAAIASRTPAVADRISPSDLAVHIMRGMLAWLSEGRRVCVAEEPQWLARPYRWVLVGDALAAQVRDDPEGGPHPRTAEWGIPALSLRDQHALVSRWIADDQRNLRKTHEIAFGVGEVSVIETVLETRTFEPRWRPRLEQALQPFRDLRWPLDYLAPRLVEAPG